MMTPGLRIRRRINPQKDLRNWLETMGEIEEIEDKQGKVHLYIDDAVPRPDEISREIVNRATECFIIFDQDNNSHYMTTSAQKAEQALKGATVTFRTDLEVDDMPEADPEPEGPDLPPARGRR